MVMNRKQIEKEAMEEFERDNNFWDGVGMYCAVMMILCLVGIFFMLFINIQHANAGEMDAWEFNIMGINPRDFEDRKILPIIGGAVVSLAVHEIGHLASAELMGSNSHFSWSERLAYAGDGYYNWSDDKKALYHGAGFLAQTVTGSILTAIPKTRHSDFTLGFNASSSVTGFSYGITRGFNGSADENSDVNNLDKYGYNGRAIAIGTGAINGAFAYISLNKDKGEYYDDSETWK